MARGSASNLSASSQAGETRPEATAVMMMVNSVDYLLQEGNWLAFLNKAAFCRSTHRRFYLWIGELPSDELDARHGVPWMRCEHRPGNTLNIYKALAFLALFEIESSIFYLDADAWFSDAAFAGVVQLEDYFRMFPGAYLFGNQNREGGPLIPMNGGLLCLRDRPQAHSFLALWWWSRCGQHDQLPLWATLFASVAAAVPNARFAFSPSLFSRYEYAHHRAVEVLAARADALRASAGLDDDDDDGGSFRATHRVTRPLQLPGTVVVLPTAPFAGLPALRSDVNASATTFCCHTRITHVEGDGQCVGANICAKRKCAPFVGAA